MNTSKVIRIVIIDLLIVFAYFLLFFLPVTRMMKAGIAVKRLYNNYYCSIKGNFVLAQDYTYGENTIPKGSMTSVISFHHDDPDIVSANLLTGSKDLYHFTGPVDCFENPDIIKGQIEDSFEELRSTLRLYAAIVIPSIILVAVIIVLIPLLTFRRYYKGSNNYGSSGSQANADT